MRCFKTPYHKELKELILSYVKKVKVDTPNLKGYYYIKNIRFYNYSIVEVDISFKGELYCRMHSKLEWRGSEIMNENYVSKIKVNKRLRNNLISDLRTKLKFFGVSVANNYDFIKKINWE